METAKLDRNFSGEENYVAKAFKRCEKEGLLPDYFSELEKDEQTMIFGEYSYEDDIRVQRQKNCASPANLNFPKTQRFYIFITIMSENLKN